MEEAGFDIFITAYQEQSYQQNLTGRKMALLVLSTINWGLIKANIVQIMTAVNSATPGIFEFANQVFPAGRAVLHPQPYFEFARDTDTVETDSGSPSSAPASSICETSASSGSWIFASKSSAPTPNNFPVRQATRRDN